MESDLSNQNAGFYWQSQECLLVQNSLIKQPQRKIKESISIQEEIEQPLKINSQISSCSSNTINQKIYNFYEILLRKLQEREVLTFRNLIQQYKNLFEEILRNRNPSSYDSLNQQSQEEEVQIKKDPFLQSIRQKSLIQSFSKQNFQDNLQTVLQKMDNLKVDKQKFAKRNHHLQEKNLGLSERLKEICQMGKLSKQLTHSSLKNVSFQIKDILKKYQKTLCDIQSLYYDFQSRIKMTQTIDHHIYSPQSERIIKKIKKDSKNIFNTLKSLERKVQVKDKLVNRNFAVMQQNILVVKKTLDDNDSAMFELNHNFALQGQDNSDLL